MSERRIVNINFKLKVKVVDRAKSFKIFVSKYDLKILFVFMN